MNENITDLITSVKVYKLAEVSKIPVRTLYRWADKNKLPGHASVQAVHRKRIESAVRKLKRRSKAQ